MATPDFEKSSKLATQLLYEQNLENRILDIQTCNYPGKTILFESIQNYALLVRRPISDFISEGNKTLKDGCTLVLGNNMYLVLYNAEINNWEHLNWTLAHEIGHIYLDHTDDGPIEEIEAHFFAAQFFMPEYSLWMASREHGMLTSEDLMEIYGVSELAALKRLGTCRRKALFRGDTIDKKIWEQQKYRVDLYFQCKEDGVPYRFELENYLDTKYECEHYMLQLLTT